MIVPLGDELRLSGKLTRETDQHAVSTRGLNVSDINMRLRKVQARIISLTNEDIPWPKESQ